MYLEGEKPRGFPADNRQPEMYAIGLLREDDVPIAYRSGAPGLAVMMISTYLTEIFLILRDQAEAGRREGRLVVTDLRIPATQKSNLVCGGLFFAGEGV